jgi:CheY-like chemotaxis protein
MAASPGSLLLLVVEDDDGDALLIEELLAEGMLREYAVQRVRSLAEAASLLPYASCVLLDLVLPDVQGLEGVRRIRERAPAVPLVVMSGLCDDVLGAQAIGAGASDYLLKGRIYDDLLARVIRYAATDEQLRDTQRQLTEALLKLGPSAWSGGHVFISYVSEDSELVDTLQADLEAAGITVWRDRTNLGPGDRWKDAIRRAISSGAFFLSCFSAASNLRNRSYMNEELTLAIEELRVRSRDQVWFLPVVFPGGQVPCWPIGANETLCDFNFISLTPDCWPDGIAKLIRTIRH